MKQRCKSSAIWRLFHFPLRLLCFSILVKLCYWRCCLEDLPQQSCSKFITFSQQQLVANSELNN